MKITEEKKGDIIVFSIDGRLDSSTSPDVDKKIIEAILNGSKNVVLNFHDLDYLSSAGIRILVHCHKEIEKKGGSVVLASLPKAIENVLYITGFLPYFKVFDSKEHAIVALEKAKT